MKISLLRLPVLCLSLLFTREVRGEFNPAIVSGDSRWVVYADLNSLRESPIGKQLVTAANKFQFQANTSPLQINVPKLLATIGSITAYGANFTKDPNLVDGSLVIQGTPELRQIAEALLIEGSLAHPDMVTEVKDLGFSAYALSASNGKPGPRVIVAFPPEPIVLVSKSADQLRRARELFLGHGKSLADNASSPLNPLMGESGRSTLFAASLVPSEQLFPENSPHARILHMANSGSIALGDDAGKTFAHVQLVASSDDMADKLQKILQGMAAMMSLGESSDQQLTEFLNSAVVARKDNTVTLQLAYSSERLAQMVQHMMESAPIHHPGGSDRSIGKVAAAWTIAAAPAPESGAATAAPGLKTPVVAVANGGTIIFRIDSADLHAWNKFDSVRIVAADASGGAGAPPLVFSRKFMTELKRPMARLEGHAVRREFQFFFPGETGSYTLEVRFTPSSVSDVKLSVGIANPAPEAAPAAEPAHDSPAPANDRS